MDDLLCVDTLSELVDQVGKELVESLIEELAEDAGSRITRMESLLSEGNMDDLRKEAHTLKSSTGTMGLKEISGQAAVIEKKLVTDEGPDVDPIVPALADMLQESLTAARGWIDEN